MSVVTPLVGVWIEIGQTGASGAGLAVTPLVGVWIEIHSLAVQASLVMRHSPCGSVDGNKQHEIIWYFGKCHSPCGSVD